MDSLESYEQFIDNELKKIIDEVKQDLFEISNDEKIKDLPVFEEISQSLIDSFLEKNELQVQKTYRDNMKTIFSLAKYLQLLFYQEDIHKRIKKDLFEGLLNDLNIDWYLYTDFTNQIQFTKNPEINSEEKPQNLLIKYRINKETNELIYSIISGNWGWDLNKYELKALLSHTFKTNINKVQEDNKPIQFGLIPEADGVTVNAGNVKIIIKKQ